MVVGGVTALCLVSEAGAVVTISSIYLGTRTLTLRVGTATAGAIDTVQFNVGGATVGNSLPYAAAVNGNGVAIAASSGGAVAINMKMQVPASKVPQNVTTTVTYPPALTCISGGCGSAAIPFSKIRWTTNSPSSLDFQSGYFSDGGSPKTIQSGQLNSTADPLISLVGGTFDVSNTMTFTYINDVAYPAGNYSGTVTYTATLP